MKLQTIIVEYENIEFELIGYFSPKEPGTFDHWSGGTPPSEASFDYEKIIHNDKDFTFLLDESVINNLIELAVKNLE